MSKKKRVLILCLVGGVLLTMVSGSGAAEPGSNKGYLVFTHNTLLRLPGDHVPAQSAVVDEVSCALAQGEYKSLQIGIHASAGPLQSVRIELTTDLEARIYRPIDQTTGKLLLGYENPVPAWIHDACLDEADEIATIEKGRTSFFWLTFHAREAAAAGQHLGKIRIQPTGKPATELDLKVTVRPFRLQRARVSYAPFFYVAWRGGALPDFAQTDQWIGAIFRDMAEHSHTSVIGLTGVSNAAIDFSELPPPENRTFTMLLPQAQQAGLINPHNPVMLMDHNLSPESELTGAQKQGAVAWYDVERRRQGWPELIAYGWDEPHYPTRYPRHRELFEPFRSVPMRVGTAMDAGAAYGLGDMHDIWIVYGGQITSEMCAEADRLGAEVWTYIPAHLSSLPLHERYFAGLYVWAYGLKGHTTWHHYAQEGFKLIWMREGDQRPMPLVGWETRREGIDDYRYLQMLEDCLMAAPDASLAREAKQWLDQLRTKIKVDPLRVGPGKPLVLDEYDQIREKVASYIQRLGPVPAAQIAPIPPRRLLDEAQYFRGKSVRQCIAGLGSEQVTQRRSAAWALFEKGPQAAAAVSALAGVLDDPDVCIPALRALEAIGHESRLALPELTALLKHPDGFVRMGAAYTLGAVGKPAVAALAQAVAIKDEYHPAAGIARRSLAAMGSAVVSALPTLIRLLDGPTWESQQVALETIAVIGPEAVSAVPHIVRNWKVDFSHHVYWIESLALIGPGAAAGVPLLEEFREKYGDNTAQGVEPRVLWALYRIRRSPEDLRALVGMISTGQGANASVALPLVENLGAEASAAVPQIRELIAQGDLNVDVRHRLELFIGRLAEQKSVE